MSDRNEVSQREEVRSWMTDVTKLHGRIQTPVFVFAPASLAPTVGDCNSGVVYCRASKLSAYDTGSLGDEGPTKISGIFLNCEADLYGEGQDA